MNEPFGNSEPLPMQGMSATNQSEMALRWLDAAKSYDASGLVTVANVRHDGGREAEAFHTKLFALAQSWEDAAAESWGEDKDHAAMQRCCNELRALLIAPPDGVAAEQGDAR